MKRSKAEAGIVGKAVRHGGDQGIDPGHPVAQAQSRLGQRVVAFGHQWEHGAGALLRPFPEQVIEAPDVQIALIEERLVTRAQGRRRVARHRQPGPGRRHHVAGGLRFAAGHVRIGQRQCAHAGAR
jgi:hypothetical protein